MNSKLYWYSVLDAVISLVVVGVIVVMMGTALWWVAGSALHGLTQLHRWWGEQQAEIERENAAWETSPTNPVFVCVSRGGVPVTGAWTNGLKRCDFPPEETREYE